MLVLSVFPRVHEVSALVPRHATIDRASHPAAWGRAHGPHRAAAAAQAAVVGPPALRPRATARHVAGLGRPPLPLTSGARWLVEGIREGDLFFFLF